MEKQKTVVLMLLVFIAALCLTTVSCTKQTNNMKTNLIPRELIFGNPEKSSPQISPDGEHLTWLAPDGGAMNIWIKTIGKEDDRVLTSDRHRGIRSYFWAPNGGQILFVQDKDGDENWHIYSVPAEGGEQRDLTPIPGIKAQIVAVDKNFPDEILVGINDRIPMLHDVYRLNITTGEMKLEAANDMGVVGWIADHNFVLRIAQIPTQSGGFSLIHRESADDDWKPLKEWGNEDALTTGAFTFTKDNDKVYLMSSVESNTTELRTLDVSSGKEEIIASDPKFDIAGLMVDGNSFELQAVRFARDRSEWQAIDPNIQKHLDALNNLHHGDYYVVGKDKAEDNWLVMYNSDNSPYVYYSYNVETLQGALLFSTRPKLQDFELAEMQPVTVKARDGLDIPCYLTLPPGIEHRNLPAVVNIHGGPWVRDSWGFNSEVQWLANRGYAVLQVNYRGSTGYGKDYINAANGEWGGTMQDDVTDATNWLIEKGYADKNKVAIYGGSYGGFAVLSGVTKEPDLYACGVDLVGPSNLLTWLKTIPPYWEPLKPMLYKRVGDPVKDLEKLTARSPINHIDKIKVPLLIGQGANDPRVPRSESIQIRDALEAGGKIVEYIEFADEGHGFARPENRLKFYANAERFLSEHIGGRFEE